MINDATRVTLTGSNGAYHATWHAPRNGTTQEKTYAITLFAQDDKSQQSGPVAAGTVTVRRR